jgi:hypothetical protein
MGCIHILPYIALCIEPHAQPIGMLIAHDCKCVQVVFQGGPDLAWDVSSNVDYDAVPNLVRPFCKYSFSIDL